MTARVTGTEHGSGDSADLSNDASGLHTRALAPGLYLVATPIGNLGDLSRRALEILAGADVIACEDTRVTGPLLKREGITARLMPYHDHNGERARPGLLKLIEDGKAVALVSDAGTPLVSDPGYRLVQEALEHDLYVTAIPGASAVLTALQLSGLPSDRFFFAGFLSSKSGSRKRALKEISSVPGTLIFYEAGTRLAESLADMSEMLGDRSAAVARELTKRFEEVRRERLSELARLYRTEGAPRGEIVVVVGPPDGESGNEPDLDTLLLTSLAESSVKEAVAKVTAETGLPRKTVYARALSLTRKE